MINVKPGEKIVLPKTGTWPETVHIFDEKSIWALKTAIAANRPLLIRGEPGCGKSQLARAAAIILKRKFLSEVVHVRKQSEQLQWEFDAVARLGEAQTLATSQNADIYEKLDPAKFLVPGILWWAFDWESATKQAELSHRQVLSPAEPNTEHKGCVLLIDEIDKADTDLPNGLLETLGNGAFPVPYLNEIVSADEINPPLVIITTNEERELPKAFLRRCLVLHMGLPDDRDKLIEWLTNRGGVHYGEQVSENVRIEAAEMLYKDRKDAIDFGHPKPGQAEYLDLLRALTGIATEEKEQLAVLKEIAGFALNKSDQANS